MSYGLTTHTLFEWREEGQYMSRFLNRLDPRYPEYEHKPGVRRTAVNWKLQSVEGLDGHWIDASGTCVWRLPWKEV